MQDAAQQAVVDEARAAEVARAKADQLMADAEVAAAEKLFRAAQIEFAMAATQQQQLSSTLGQVRACNHITFQESSYTCHIGGSLSGMLVSLQDT